MQEFSFRIEKDLTPISQDVVTANFSECKAVLTEIMAPYKSLVVTEDTIPQAKNDLAKIRKVKSNIEDMRKTVKKAYMQPVAVFENKCKELTGILDEAAGNIDGQVKSFLNAEIAEKVSVLKAHFIANAGDMQKYICFEDIYNKRWENKTYGLDKAKQDIDDAIQQSLADVETLRSIGGPFTITLLDMYRHNHDLHECIQCNQRLIQEKEIADRKEKDKRTGNAEDPANEQSGEDVNSLHPVYAVDFRVWTTEDQLNMLKVFLKTNHIKYGKVPKGE